MESEQRRLWFETTFGHVFVCLEFNQHQQRNDHPKPYFSPVDCVHDMRIMDRTKSPRTTKTDLYSVCKSFFPFFSRLFLVYSQHRTTHEHHSWFELIPAQLEMRVVVVITVIVVVVLYALLVYFTFSTALRFVPFRLAIGQCVSWVRRCTCLRVTVWIVCWVANARAQSQMCESMNQNK